MKVLSLFDGISCARVALERAGIPVEAYYASEIDKYAIQVSQKNYPDIQHIGSVTEVTGYSDIDILVGGSPCQGFSFAGKQLNFEDDRSKLFFEYVRILRETKPKYFLLENVPMKKESEDVITEMLGVKPIMIDSSLVSGTRRKRLYWTNIPNVKQPKDRGILIKDIIYDNSYKNFADERIENTKKFTKNYIKYDLSGKGYFSQQDRSYFLEGKMCTIPHANPTNKCNILLGDKLHRRLHPIEAERLHNLPDNYTKCEGITDTRRISLVGNAWVVDVVAHILSFIKK